MIDLIVDIILKIDMLKSGLLEVNDLWLNVHEYLSMLVCKNAKLLKAETSLQDNFPKLMRVFTQTSSFLISPPSWKQIHAEKFKFFIVTQLKNRSVVSTWKTFMFTQCCESATDVELAVHLHFKTIAIHQVCREFLSKNKKK